MVYELAVVVSILAVVAISAFYSKSVSGDENQEFEQSSQWFKSFFFILSFVFLDVALFFSKLVANSNGASSSILNIINISFIVMSVVTAILLIIIMLRYVFFVINQYRFQKEQETRDEVVL